MPLFSTRGKTPRLAPELDDVELGRLLKRLRSTKRSSPAGATDIAVAQIAQVLDQDPQNFDRRTHRLSVLAGFLSESHLPAAWVKREPQNVNALVLYSLAELEHGRSSGALTDGSATWRRCHLAADLDPQNPSPWVAMLGIARLMRAHRREVFAIWDEIVARDRWHREAHLSMLHYLGPQESGSLSRAIEFADSELTRMPPNAPCAAVELEVHLMRYHSAKARGGAEALLARDQWGSPQTAQFLDRAQATWPRLAFFSHAAAVSDLNLLAYALTAAGRLRGAAPVFEAVGGRVTSWPWRCEGDPLTVFESARNKAR
ncbi:hypothetical protein [Streptomyces sp. HUAS ZL42]|uniref:hypothetical protein n=1 Tax=Streptomyces sp. HUAS ZL42 TaxID=3231715 RepID=UPI00345E8405